MVEAIFLFLAKVVTVIICAGFLVLPLYLIATLFYAIYKDCRCPNKAKSTRDKISAWFFILISSSHKASAYHSAKSSPHPAVGSMCKFERMRSLFVYSTLFILLFPPKKRKRACAVLWLHKPVSFHNYRGGGQPAATASCFCWQTGMLGAHEGLLPLDFNC